MDRLWWIMSRQEDDLMLIAHIKRQLKHWRYRLTILNKYRDMDLDKEILDCMNEITKLKKRLREIRGKDES